jgi:uncharacterized protein (TIGR03435 family)
MRAACVILAGLLSAVTFGQAVDDPAKFEIADVHACPKTLHPSMRSGVLRPGVYQLKMATMVDLIAAAYGVDGEKVLGGPSWLDTDRFDVIAKAPDGAPQQAVRPMLQALLVERFKLAVHMDQRPMAAFVLSMGKGKPKLKQADGSGPSGCRRVPQAPDASTNAVECRGLTMEAFVQQLHGAAGDYLTNPVVDESGLAGSWDFTLKWTPRGMLAAAGAEGIPIFDAVANQLGLKLEPKQVPTPVLVVDSVNQKPTENSPDVMTRLPPLPPPSFEVATIKPTDPQFQGVRIQTPPNGQINIQGLTLSFLIQTIWFVTPDGIPGAPKWLDTDRWDITAKVAAVPGSPPQTDMDSLIVMVRALLEDRFQLKTHTEERVVPAYTLTAPKPKLQKANPEVRAGCKEGPGADGKDPRITNPALSRLVSCRNVTMAQFAELLPNIANALSPLSGGYLRSAVLDSTGLGGAYDFTLSFSPWSAVQNGGPGRNGGPGQEAAGGAIASDPNGALSLFDAIDKQLGLKLELVKRPAEVLVIDHIQQKPTGN